METGNEIEAMRLFERALEHAPGERAAWLAAQDLPPELNARVLELLAAEQAAGEFLEAGPELRGIGGVHASMPAAGDRLGAWRLERPLDAGGMGIVFLARRADGAYEQQVAIKFVRTGDLLLSPSRHADLVVRFGNERRLLARLDHPNIVRILDGGTTATGVPYLVMEYVDGLDLIRYCEQHRLDVGARVSLLAKVCDGVQAAHRHLIVHRDLKPHNILVGADGEPRVLDFGIARVLDSEDGDIAGTTRTAMQAMTPAYASPEQMRHEPLTTASDVYSLGVILYELLAGVRPYALDGTSPAQSERIVCESQPPTLRKALGGAGLPEPERRARLARIGSDLERIVARALHKDPERRYGSAQAFADDLRRHLEGRPVQAHPDTLGYRLAKFASRHRYGTAAGTLALAAVLAAAGIAFWQAAQARRAAADLVEINGFLVDVLQVSNPYASGSEITLAEALDDAAAKVDERFGTRPDLAVDIRYALGESMLGRYRIDAAEQQLLRALADSEGVFGRNDARSIRALGALASLRKEQGRVSEAKDLFADALRRIDEGGQGGTALHSSILNDLGVLHLIQEDFAEADRHLQQALQLGDTAQPAISADERAQTLGNLAHAARGLGNFDRADALYQQVQSIFERLHPDGSPYLAVVLNNRARVARGRKLPEQSLALLQQAVAMHRRSFAGDHVMILVPMTNLARQALDLGQLDLAAEWGEKAVAMGDRMYVASNHHYHAQALTTLADIRVGQGRFDDADTNLVQARRSLDALEAPHEPSLAFHDKVRAHLCEREPRPALESCAGT